MGNIKTSPLIEIQGFKGLNTKSAQTVIQPQQLRIAENVDYFTVYGAVGRCKGNTRVLAAQQQESGSNVSISWIGFYKYSDLDGQILRQVLVADGTNISLLEGSALTSKKSGRKSGLVHASTTAGRFMFIQNQNPLLVGAGDDPIKWDGHEISNWGVREPGEDLTTVDAMDDATEWTASGVILTNETTVTRDGTSLKTVSGDGASNTSITKTYSPTVDLPDEEADRVNLSVYINPPDFDLLATSGRCLSLYFGSDSNLTTNFYRYDFRIGQLIPGWQTLACDLSSAPTGNDGTSSGSFNTSAMQITRFESLTTNASDVITIYYDKYETKSLATVAVGFSGSGSTFTNDATLGIWRYRVTFVTKYGVESNAGNARSADNRGGAQSYLQVDVSRIPTSSDPQVIARRIYRTVANGSVFLRLATINDNVTTTYTDTTADASLGTLEPPTSGSLTNDSAPPPKGGIIKEWKKTLFIAGDPENPSLLYFSRDAKPEQFPLVNFFDLEQQITGIFETALGLVVTTRDALWRVTGVNPNFDIEKALVGVGCVGPRAVGLTRLIGWAIDLDGFRFYDLRETSKISAPIRDKYDNLNRDAIETLQSVHLKRENTILQLNPNADGDFDSAFRYQYMVDDVRDGMWSTVDFPSSLNFQSLAEIEDSAGDTKLYAGGDDGMIYELYTEGQFSWTLADGTTEAIPVTIETPYFRPGDLSREQTGLGGRISPKYIELKVINDGNATTTWTATISMSDGPSSAVAKDSVDIEMEVGVNNSLLRYPVPKTLHPYEFMKIKFTNTDADIDTKILGFRILFEAHPGQNSITDVDSST